MPMIGVILLLVVVVLAIIVEIGVRAVHRADAQTAADMAALAGVFEGQAGATDLARRNGAVLMSYREEGVVVLVQVAIDGARAEAVAVLDYGIGPNVENEPPG
ncbi:MAG: helicase [Actinomycetia bacterium]|nr:helicase [Actinomycetes bacterium]MCP5032491.1 helicase [Actinomycetes bacterium]